MMHAFSCALFERVNVSFTGSYPLTDATAIIILLLEIVRNAHDLYKWS